MTDLCTTGGEKAERCAQMIYDSFLSHRDEFGTITRRARARFETRDWSGHQNDVRERLDLYSSILPPVVASLRTLLGPGISDLESWKRIKRAYSLTVSWEANRELAETFYNSITRRVFSTVGANPDIEYVTLTSTATTAPIDPTIYAYYEYDGDTTSVLRELFAAYPFSMGYDDLGRDVEEAARAIDLYLSRRLRADVPRAFEILRPLFFRDRIAYLIGRIRLSRGLLPLVLALRSTEQGVAVDAVLMDEDEISILFSFARSYFHVEAARPGELVAFLKSIMPLKPVAELYSSLGSNRHGKTELYRELRRHLIQSGDGFQIAEGDRGMVMIVFSLRLFDIVFKVIRDNFDYPKTSSRENVMNRYRLVFHRDRVGRLVDAQEFEHLRFKRELFSEALLQELSEGAAESVSIDDDYVVISHLYTERKVTPLNLHIREAGADDARRAVIDYGNAIRELAAANIFPGDFLLKNFGVTRHGRVVFYDYDELCLVTDCNFRPLPPARSDEEEMAAEPWFTVGPNDIFPEEFGRFLGMPADLRATFLEHHSDIFTVDFWREMHARHEQGVVPEFFPYPQHERLGVAGTDETSA